MAQDEDQALNEYVWNIMVLQHQARALGIEPTDEQIKDAIMALPVFQTNGQFDYRKFAAFSQERLAPNGLTENFIENVMRDSLRLGQIKDIVGAPVAVSPGEIKEAQRTLQKMDLQKVKFASPDLSTVATTEEEISAFFQRNKMSMIKPETRQVSYVEFVLPEAEAGLTGKAKIDVLQKLADQATAFAEQAAGSRFDEAAQKAGLTVKTSPEFNNAGDTQTPDGQNADLRALAPGAFLLTEQNPVSDVLQSGDKFFVMRLGKIIPQRELKLEEVRPMLEARLRATKAATALSENAAAAIAKIRAELAAGKSFADAADAAGVTAEAVNGFSINDNSLSMDQRELASVALVLQPGQISNFVPAADGGFAVFLASRAPLEGVDNAQTEEIEQGILDSKRRMLFLTWLAAAREEAKVVIARHDQGR
jgi:peptidyl-prolyl cis-trans isomerase D